MLLMLISVLGLDSYDIKDRVSLNNHLGSLAQHRECYYITCWHLFRQETLDMWEQYGHDGVAICSRYELLKSALEGFVDKAQLGLIRYGTDHLANRFNTIDFITTKQEQYRLEAEVRGWVTVPDPLAGGNRHIDLNNFPHPVPLEQNPRHSWVLDCTRRRIELRSLVQDVVISPWAEPDAVEEIHRFAKHKGFPAAARHSDLRSDHTPGLEEYRLHTGKRKPEVAHDLPVSEEVLAEFYKVLSELTPSRVRFLYRQRWETCRMVPGSIPKVADIQHLQTTLRVLADWKRQGIQVG